MALLDMDVASAAFVDGDISGRESLAWSRASRAHDVDPRMLCNSYASLTPREREVMALVVSGLLNKQVGSELGISEITVKAHRGRVMQKMEAASLPHLVTIATRLGLLHLRRGGVEHDRGVRFARPTVALPSLKETASWRPSTTTW